MGEVGQWWVSELGREGGHRRYSRKLSTWQFTRYYFSIVSDLVSASNRKSWVITPIR